jgi:hypothetical protein
MLSILDEMSSYFLDPSQSSAISVLWPAVHRLTAGKCRGRERANGDFRMMDIAMLVMGVVMFALLIVYAPLCDKM